LTDFYYETNRVFDRGTNRSGIQIPIHRQIAKINNDVWKAQITLTKYASARTRWFARKFVASTYCRIFWMKLVRFARYLTGRIVHCRLNNSDEPFYRSLQNMENSEARKIQRREINLWIAIRENSNDAASQIIEGASRNIVVCE